MEFMKKIEEISKKVGKTATETYNTVADKSGKLIEETKMKISISDKQNEIDEVYENIGKTVYDMYVKGEDVGKAFTKEAKKIDKIKNEIEEISKKILYNKGLRNCSSCGEVISIDSSFCELCGSKQKVLRIKEEKKEEQENESKTDTKDKVCPQCGLVTSFDSKFCARCGYKF